MEQFETKPFNLKGRRWWTQFKILRQAYTSVFAKWKSQSSVDVHAFHMPHELQLLQEFRESVQKVRKSLLGSD
jgi:hypothetical protein